MTKTDKTFIRVYKSGAAPQLEGCEIPRATPVELESCQDQVRLTLDSDDAPFTPKVICEVYDYHPTGTNVVTAGLFLDALADVAKNESDKKTPDFAAWEVDKFDFPKTCEVIGQYAAETLDAIAENAWDQDASRNIVTFRSWARGAGRTTLAICMARRLAATGKKVVLLDGDLDHPELCRQLGVSFSQGWDSVVIDDVAIEDCCIASVHDQFTIVPLGDRELDLLKTENIERIRAAITKLASEFEIVLIDAGPGSQIWDSVVDADQLGVVVVQDRRRPNSDTDDLLQRIKRRNATVFGLIDNFSRAA